MSANPLTQQDHAETDAFVKAIHEGIADADAGRTVSYSAVRDWLLTWGTDHEKPAPQYKP